MAAMHLSWTYKKIRLILAGFDPAAVDAVASKLLGHNPKELEYLKLANGLLSELDNIETLEVQFTLISLV